MPREIARAALYVRVSTDEQAEEGQSIEAQLEALRAYASAHGMVVVDEFVDRGFSATTDRRPAFQRMIASAKKKPKPFDIILVHKQDRFARNREHAIVYKNLLRKECGVDVVSIMEPFEDSPQGRLMEGLMEVMAEFYSANLGQEVLKGMRHKATTGAALGMAPVGYRIGDSGSLQVDPSAAPVVKWIFDRYLSGESTFAIANELRLNGRARFGPSFPNFKWSPQSIQVILKNETYLGVKVWGSRSKRSGDQPPIRVEHAHEAIISPEVYAQAQNRLSTHRGGPRSRYGDYLLRGVVRCGMCGGSMILVMQQSHPDRDGNRTSEALLACSRYYRGLCHPRNWVRMSDIEEAIGTVVRDLINGAIPLTAVEWEVSEDVPEYRLTLKRQLEASDLAFKRQLVAYEEGIIDLAELRAAKSRVSAEKREIERKLNEIEHIKKSRHVVQGDVRRRLSRALDALVNGSLPLEARRQVLSNVVAGATWHRGENRLLLKLKVPDSHEDTVS